MIKNNCLCFSWVLICFFLIENALYIHPDSNSNETRFSQIENDSLKVKILLDSSIRFLPFDFIKSLEFAKMADDISINSNDSELLKLTSLQLVKLFFQQGLYENAINYLARLSKISGQDKNYEWIGKYYFQLGSIRLVMEDYGLAENHFNRAKSNFLKVYRIEDQIPLNLRIGFCNNLGIVYGGLAKYDKAEKQFEKGIELAKEHVDYYPSLIQLLNNMGDVMSKKKQLDKAVYFYEEAMSFIKLSPNTLFESMLYNSLGKIELEREDYDLALQYFHKGYLLAQTMQGYSHLKHLAENLSTSYAALGNSDSALVYLNRSKVYADRLSLRKASEKIIQQELLSQFALGKPGSETFITKNKMFLTISFYGLIFLLGVFSVRYFQLKRSVSHILEVKLDAEINSEKLNQANEKLTVEMNDNNKLFSIKALNDIKKNFTLDQLAEAFLKNSVSNLDFEEQRKLKESILKLKEVKTDKTLNEFEFIFNHIYLRFFEKLLNDFPNLTLNERRLVAFLKLQLTTKEISIVTGQSVRAIEIARTRIRKKVGLTKSYQSLYDFFINY
jgi:tetratricopeptide (TPR) repeat protein